MMTDGDHQAWPGTPKKIFSRWRTQVLLRGRLMRYNSDIRPPIDQGVRDDYLVLDFSSIFGNPNMRSSLSSILETIPIFPEIFR